MMIFFLSCSELQSPVNSKEIVSQETMVDTTQQELAELNDMLKNPQKSKIICQKTTFPAVQQQCKRIQNRPHLYNHNPSQKGGSNHLQSPYKSPLATTEPSKEGCSNGNYPCILQQALKATTQQERAAECLAVSNSTWRSECFFETAEQGLLQKKLSYAESADLCSLTTPFLYNCLQHLSIVLAEQQKTLSDYRLAGDKMNDFWADRDKKILQKMSDIYWSTAMEMYYSKQHLISNEPFQTLPKNAHPHIWAGISRKVVRHSRKKKTLQEWTDDLKKVFHGEKKLTFSKKSPANNHRRPLFPKNIQSSYQQVIYSEEHTRILGTNIEEEIQISLLYSSALYNRFSNWKEEAKSLSSPRVQESIK